MINYNGYRIFEEKHFLFTLKGSPKIGYRKMYPTGSLGPLHWTQENVEEFLTDGFWQLDKADIVKQFITENL